VTTAEDRPEPRQQPRHQRLRLGYLARQRLSLLLVALVPLAAFGAVTLSRLQTAVAQDADARTAQALRAVGVVVDRAGSQLLDTVDSYATWDTLRAQVASLDLGTIRSEVIDFQVTGGAIDAAVLRVGAQQVEGGGSLLASALASEVGRRLAESPPSVGGAGLADLDGQIYSVAIRPIDLSGLAGPGVTQANAQGGAWLAFAQRLGPSFALDAYRLTGFQVALYGESGSLLVASDASEAAQIHPLTAGVGEGTHFEQTPTALAALAPLRGPDGRFLGTLAAMTDLGLLGTLDQALVPLLAIAFALAAVLALALAVYLAERLRQRIHTVERGLEAAASGQGPSPLRVDGDDELARLAASHNRLAAALQRRERILRASEAALAELDPGLGRAAVMARGSAAARDVFSLRSCELTEAPGPGDQPTNGPPPSSNELVVACPHDGHQAWLVAEVDDPDWSDADQAQLAAYARALGAAINDAGRLEATSAHAADLDRLTRLQADFLRGVGHNLQTPLTRILALADDLRSEETATPLVRRRIDAIRREARRLARLVGQLLTTSRLEAGAFRPEEQLVALAPLVRSAWASLSDRRRLSIDDRSDGALAVADRAAVEQILWILLDNVSRYAPTGAVIIRLDPPDAGQVELRVEDHGPGISPEDDERIFQRFVRGSQSATQEGTGLGLSVARGLAEALGGSLRAEPTAGGGATFVLRLPGELPAGEA
jgi:signal transduction histidine kinase